MSFDRKAALDAWYQTLAIAKTILTQAGYGCGSIEPECSQPWITRAMESMGDPRGFSDRFWVINLAGQPNLPSRRYIAVGQPTRGLNTIPWPYPNVWPHHHLVQLTNDYPACPEIPGKIAMALESAGVGCLVRTSVRDWMEHQSQPKLGPVEPAEFEQWTCLGDFLHL